MSRKRLVFLPLIVVLALLLAPSVGSAQSATPTTYYIVKAGDTLGDIAWRLGIDVRALQAANRLRNAEVIYPGQVLILPASGDAVDGSGGCGAT